MVDFSKIMKASKWWNNLPLHSKTGISKQKCVHNYFGHNKLIDQLTSSDLIKCEI